MAKSSNSFSGEILSWLSIAYSNLIELDLSTNNLSSCSFLGLIFFFFFCFVVVVVVGGGGGGGGCWGVYGGWVLILGRWVRSGGWGGG